MHGERRMIGRRDLGMGEGNFGSDETSEMWLVLRFFEDACSCDSLTFLKYEQELLLLDFWLIEGFTNDKTFSF